MSDRTADREATDRPAEMPPDDAGTLRQWVLFLAGPVLFMVDFAVVYLAAEASCRAAEVAEFAFPGPDALRILILAATAVSTAVIVYAGAVAMRAARNPESSERDRMLSWAGSVLGVGSAVGVLALGLPVLVIDPC